MSLSGETVSSVLEEDVTNTSAYRSFGVLEEINEKDEENEPVSVNEYIYQTDKKCLFRESGGVSSGGSNSKREALLENLRRNVIGEDEAFTGPFEGDKYMIYADWTASGRGLRQLEQYLVDEVLPTYGNTHTTTSRSGHQSTCFRHEARQVVAEAVNAKITGKAALDVVLFTGNGTTSAINKLVLALGLHLPLPESLQADPVDCINSRPVVFVSSYEHHSNILPWREAAADVITVRFSENTGVCLHHLQMLLEQYKDRKLKIGAFAAASNVTGVLTDVDSVSILMHKAGGIAIYDYATAAPYVKMDMNPVNTTLGEDSALVYKDAIIFSGHKFVGGPGCPGVLIAKKRLLPPPSAVPTTSGGGTVFFVTEDSHRYLSNREEREEGGTPGIISDIRMGLVMHIKQSVGSSWIEKHELETARKVHSRLSSNPAIHLLGHPHPGVNGLTHEGCRPGSGKYLPIVSFLIQPIGMDRCLHYNFVSALLNDLFGIQSRGGCMCAGPYSQLLLGIPSSFNTCKESDTTTENSLNDLLAAANTALEYAVLDKQEVYRPGFTRLSFPFFMSDEKIEYILRSIEFVASKGALFLPHYRYNHKTGEYAHATRLTKFPERKWLTTFDLSNSCTRKECSSVVADDDGVRYEQMLCAAEKEADRIWSDNLKKLKKKRSEAPSSASISHNASYEEVRWFIITSDYAHSLPTVATATGTDISLRKTLKGPLHPNALLDTSSDATALKAALFGEVPLPGEGQHVEISLYAKKRDKKMGSRLGNLSVETPKGEIGVMRVKPESSLPRYVNAQDIAKSKTKSNILIAHKTIDEPSVESTSSGVVATVEKAKDHMLGGNEVVFPESNSQPSPGSTLEKNTESSDQKGEVSSDVGSSVRKLKIPVPPKKLLKTVGQAISDWRMIEDGDRLLLGLSGGKDSLCLLHILRHIQRIAPVKFKLACATVDPQTDSFDPSPLIPYLKSLDITYHYLSEPIVAMAKERLQGDSLCAFCARFKRGLLYSCCRDNNYNKLVLAQHLDDLAESFMMSALHNGQIRTMKANYPIDNKDDNIRVIRPLVYTREQATRDFSLSQQLPVINENCPACFEEPKERARMKKLLSQEEAMIPSLFNNMKRALTPLMHEDIYTAMGRVISEIEASSAAKNRRHTGKGNVGKGNQKRSVDELEEQGTGSNGESKKLKLDNDNEVASVASSSNAQQCTAEYCAPCYELA